MLNRSSLTLIAAMATSIPSLSQQPVDVMKNECSDGSAQVLLLPGSDFDGVLSSLLFTLSWDTTDTPLQPTLWQLPEQAAMLALAPSGPALIAGTRKFQRYAGIGLVPLSDLDTAMHAGQSFAIAQVSASSARIANEPWLQERAHNGAFYISLNGLDKTGEVIQALNVDQSASPGSFLIAPNPWTSGAVQYELLMERGGLLRFSLIDSRGQEAWSWTTDHGAGHARGQLSLPVALAPGQYTLWASHSGLNHSLPFSVLGR